MTFSNLLIHFEYIDTKYYLKIICLISTINKSYFMCYELIATQHTFHGVKFWSMGKSVEVIGGSNQWRSESLITTSLANNRKSTKFSNEIDPESGTRW